MEGLLVMFWYIAAGLIILAYHFGTAVGYNKLKKEIEAE
jgi:hypothetical protein